METDYLNHAQVDPATTSRLYQYEDPEQYRLGYELWNHSGLMHYGEVVNGHSPTPYEPLPVFPHPAGYMTNPYQYYTYDAMMNASNFVYEPQFNCVQQSLFSFEENRLRASHSQESGLYSCSSRLPVFSGNSFSAHQSDVYSGRFLANEEGYVPTHSHCFHWSPANANFLSSDRSNMGGWTRNSINDGVPYGIYSRASSSRFNILPKRNVCLRPSFPLPSDRIVDDDKLYANVIEDPYRNSQGSVVAASNPFSWTWAGLHRKNDVRMSRIHSSYTSAGKISDERKSSQQQHGFRNTVRTFPSNSSVSPTVGASGSTNGKKQPGQRGQAQRSRPTQSSKDPAVPVRRSVIQRTSAPKDRAPPVRMSGIQKPSAFSDFASPIKRKNASTSKDCTPSIRRSSIQKTSASKDRAPPVRRSGIQKTSASNDFASPFKSKNASSSEVSTPSIRRSAIQKTSASKDRAPPVRRSGIQKFSASKDRAPPVNRSVIQKTSAPCQVWREKAKTQPSASRTKKSKQSTGPVHHITWDNDIDEECEPIGQNCHLCDKDFSYVPADDESENYEYYDEFEPSSLPEVSVLPCGHAFHSKCLQLITPDEQSIDPPCFLCFSCMN